MSVEIIVNIAELEKAENKLSDLSKKLANRKLNVSFTKAVGAMPDEMLKAVVQLNQIESILSDLVRRTETAVRNTRVLFNNADKEVAEYFGIAEGN